MLLEFEGPGRLEWVELLEGHVRGLLDGSVVEPRLVSLEGRPGYGKTRIVHEVYKRIAAAQATPYWPPALVDADQQGARTGRKVVGFGKRAGGGTIRVQAGARPQWMWWGVVCDRTVADARESAVRDAVDQLAQHFPALIAQAELRSEACAGVLEAGEGVVDAGLGLTLGPVGAIARGTGKTALAMWRSRRAKRRELDEHDIDADADAAGRAADLVRRVTRSGVPVILVIEDAQDADPTLLETLSQLLEQDQLPVLIIATAWDGQVGDQIAAAKVEQSYGQLLADLEEFGGRRLRRARLAPLPDAAVRRLVWSLAPHTSEGVVARLATRVGGNPYTLALLWELDALRACIVDGALTIDADEIEALPDEPDDALRRRFEQLAPSWKTAMALGSVQGRVIVPDALPLMLSAARLDVDGDDVIATLASVAAAAAGVRAEGAVIRFIEPYDLTLAQLHLRALVRPRVAAKLPQAVADFAIQARTAPGWSGRASEWRRELLTTHVRLATAVGSTLDAGPAAIAAIHLGRLELNAQPEACLRAVGAALELALDDDTRLEDRPVSAHATELLIAAGTARPAAGYRTARGALELWTADTDPSTVELCLRLAAAEMLLLTRRDIAACDLLSDDSTVTEFLKRSQILRLALSRLVKQTTSLGGEQAAAALTRRLEQAARLRGLRHLRVALSEHSLTAAHDASDSARMDAFASALAGNEQWADAVGVWESTLLLPLGAGQRRSTVRKLAFALGQLGRWDESLVHWHTLNAGAGSFRDRVGLAYALCGSQDWQRAVDAWTALASEALSGDDRTDVEVGLAFALTGAGAGEDARLAWRALMADHTSVAERALRRLAATLTAHGRRDEAVALSRALLDAVTPEDLPARLRAHVWILEHCDHAEDALTMLDELLPGLAPPAQAALQPLRQELLADTGRTAEVVVSLRQELARDADGDRADVIRRRLARALILDGQLADGRALYDELLDEAPGPISRVSLLRGLAYDLEARGCYDDAIDVWRPVLEAAGPDERCVALQQVASLHGRAKRPAEAITAWREMAELAGHDRELREQAFHGLAFATSYIEQDSEAIALLRQLLSGAVEPDDTYHLAVALAHRLGTAGDREGATTAWLRALQTADEDAEVEKALRGVGWVVDHLAGGGGETDIWFAVLSDPDLEPAVALRARRFANRNLAAYGGRSAPAALWDRLDPLPHPVAEQAELERAWALAHAGRITEARDVAQPLAEAPSKPVRDQASQVLAVIHGYAGDHAEGDRLWARLETGAASSSALDALRLARGQAECLAERWVEGESILESILPRLTGADRITVQRQLMYSYGETHRWTDLLDLTRRARDEAVAAGDRFLANAAERSTAFALERLGRFDEALAIHEAALVRATDAGTRAAAVANLGRVFEESDRLAAGADRLQELRPDGSDPAELHSWLRTMGYLLTKLERWDEALASWRSALDSAATAERRYECAHAVAYALGKLRRTDEAREQWEALIAASVSPDQRLGALLGLCYVLVDTEDVEATLRVADEVLAVTPTPAPERTVRILASVAAQAVSHDALQQRARDLLLRVSSRCLPGPARDRVQRDLAGIHFQAGDIAAGDAAIAPHEARFTATDREALARHRRLAVAREARTLLMCTVTESVRGGLLCALEDGTIVFLPRSQIGSERADTARQLEPHIGERYEVLVLKLNSLISSRACVVSRRTEPAPAPDTTEQIAALRVGDRVRATVTSIVGFGAFVVLDEGIAGLVHISELVWELCHDVASVVSVGERLDLEVVDVDVDRARVSLSRKRLHPDPRVTWFDDFSLGSVHTTVVTRVLAFGVLVQLGQFEALLHTTGMLAPEVAGERPVLAHGDEVVVEIADHNRDRVRILVRECRLAPAG